MMKTPLSILLCFIIVYLNAQSQQDLITEIETLIGNTHTVTEDGSRWSHKFDSFDKGHSILIVENTYNDAQRIVKERFNRLPLKWIKKIKVEKSSLFEQYGYACECQVSFKDHYEVRVVFYEDGSEMENDNQYNFPYKELKDCKRLKKLLKKLKRKSRLTNSFDPAISLNHTLNARSAMLAIG